MDCKQYARYLLNKENCDLDAYRGIDVKNIASELADYYTEHQDEEVPFPIDDIAECLRQIGDEQPLPPPAPYKMVFDMGHTIDSIPFDSFEAAKADMEDTYAMWLVDETGSWSNGKPTPEQIDDFNYMIDTFCCWVVKYDEELGDYEDIDYGYTLPQEELEALGWKEIEAA